MHRTPTMIPKGEDAYSVRLEIGIKYSHLENSHIGYYDQELNDIFFSSFIFPFEIDPPWLDMSVGDGRVDDCGRMQATTASKNKRLDKAMAETAKECKNKSAPATSAFLENPTPQHHGGVDHILGYTVIHALSMPSQFQSQPRFLFNNLTPSRLMIANKKSALTGKRFLGGLSAALCGKKRR